MSALAPEEVKTCCAAAYASAAARFLLGDSFHPGGPALTSRLAQALRVGPGQTVVDVASGPGTSAIQLARETGCDVVGVELSAESVRAATQVAQEAGLGTRVRFLQGDAEALPLADGSADGALCECALCTFPDKQAAAGELARVLRSGGRVAISDITARTAELPAELTSLQAWVACIADARPLEEIAALLEQAGLAIELVEPHDEALAVMLARVRARLRLARFLSPDAARRGLELVDAARAALDQGVLGYGIVVARR